MANINIENISDLDLNGNELFEDSESFMTELSADSEKEAIMGGAIAMSNNCTLVTYISCGVTIKTKLAAF